MLCGIFVLTKAKQLPLVDAANYVGCGFDARTAKYANSGPELAPIIAYHFEGQKTYTTPYSNITYAVPDEIFAKNYETVYEVSESSIVSTFKEFIDIEKSWFSFGVGIEVGVFGAGIQYNQTMKYVSESFAKDFKATASGYHVWTFVVSKSYPINILTFDPMFQLSLDKFPQTIQTDHDRTVALSFINTFGTHLVIGAILGAKVELHTSMDQEVLSTYTYSQVSEQFGFTFHYYLYAISAGEFDNQTDINIDKKFANNSDTQVFIYGGDPALANLKNIDQWVKTIDKNMFPMNVTLVGLWELIDGDDLKQKTMKDFINAYIAGQESNFVSKEQHKNVDAKNNNLLYCKNLNLDLVYQYLGCGVDITNPDIILAPIYYLDQENTFLQSYPYSEMLTFSQIMQNDFSLDASFYYHKSSSGWFGISSKSKTIHRYYQARIQENKSMALMDLYILHCKTTAPAIIKFHLDPEFEKSLDQLPKEFNEDTKLDYFEFIQDFGTEVTDTVYLGGKFTTQLWYEQNINSLYKKEDIEKYSSWSFANIIGNGHGSSSITVEENKDFALGLKSEFSFHGGNETMNPNQYLDWAHTVTENLFPVKYETIPISFFVKDSNLRLQIEKAIQIYLSNSVDQFNQFIQKLKSSHK